MRFFATFFYISTMSKIPLDQGGYNPTSFTKRLQTPELSVLTKIYSGASEFSEPHNESLGITNDIPSSSNSKIYGKEPRCNETFLQRTYFVSSLALRYIEVALYLD